MSFIRAGHEDSYMDGHTSDSYVYSTPESIEFRGPVDGSMTKEDFAVMLANAVRMLDIADPSYEEVLNKLESP